MRKLMVGVLWVALTSTAGAEGWRDLRVDGSSEEAFARSLEAFKDKLSPARRYVLAEALKDIWSQGAQAAAAEQREYTERDYYAELDGLGYKGIVTLTDPSGDTAKDRYRTASLSNRYSRPSMPAYPGTADRGSPPIGWSGQPVRGATQADMLPPGRSASGHPCGVAPC